MCVISSHRNCVLLHRFRSTDWRFWNSYSRLSRTDMTASQQSIEMARSVTSCWFCRIPQASIRSLIWFRAAFNVDSCPIRSLTLRPTLLYRDCKFTSVLIPRETTSIRPSIYIAIAIDDNGSILAMLDHKTHLNTLMRCQVASVVPKCRSSCHAILLSLSTED